MAPRKLAKITPYPINTLVRITASGGQSGDWWQRVALTGASQVLGSYHHTIIQVINPDTEELSQQPWRTEWLEVLPQGEQLEEVEALQQVIARAKSEYSDSAIEQEQSFGNDPDIPESSISLKQLEVPMVDELPPQSESSESSAVVALVEVVEELTEEEAADRHRLELTVERAFYQAGHALKELRDRRLYRSTHKTWEAYCKDRFGYGRDSADLKILAAAVVDEISKMPMIRRQKMPTTLEQVRHLTKLQPDEQREVWQQAVEQAGGRVPSGRAVKSIVDRLKEKDTTPPPIPYQVGEVVEIRAGSNSKLRKHDGCWGIVTHVGTWSCTVHISVRNVDLQCKPDEMDKIDDRYTAEIRAVNERITALMQRDDLSRTAIAVLETLVQQTCFSSDDLWFLEKVEERYETGH